MNAGHECDRQNRAEPSGPAREKAQPVSVPENADFRYDEQEAPEPGSEDEARDTKPEA
jgi:hypothetical protein